MKLVLDKYAYLVSPIHRWQQKPKLLALLCLIFAFAWVQKLILLPAMILVTATLYYFSHLPVCFLLTRLRYPSLFIAAVVILLPFLAGDTVILNWGILSIKKEGCLAVLLILTRFICILTVSLVLFGTAPFLTTLKAMRSLGLSDIIVDMMLLSYRYLEELGETLTTMQRALKLRGFQARNFSRRNLQVIASLMGSLLVRSYEQSKLVYQAMILRGYGHRHSKIERTIKFGDRHWLACWLTITIALIFVLIEVI